MENKYNKLHKSKNMIKIGRPTVVESKIGREFHDALNVDELYSRVICLLIRLNFWIKTLDDYFQTF